MTLGVAAAAGVRLIVWCKECRHQVEPDPAEMATRYRELTIKRIAYLGLLASTSVRQQTCRGFQ
jgi:hypothetical protein